MSHIIRYCSTFLKRLVALVRREKILRIVPILLVVVLSGSSAFVYFERNLSFTDALWWSVVTLTTVGYGDISPATTGGRIVGMTVMVTGIGFLGVLTASIASIFIENKLLENKGMKTPHVCDHFIICGWNFRGEEVIAELRADPKCGDLPLLVIADIPEKPMDDFELYFIRGEVNTDNLKKANLEEAHAVIVLSDDHLDAYARDAKTILNTLTIKSLNPNVYTCVELMEPGNVEHCEMAKADEIIVVGELSTNLLVQAALDHGITEMISELVSNRYGKDLYKIGLPAEFVGQTFFDAICRLKKEHDILCLGIRHKADEKFVANPESGYKLRADDQLVIIASERPDMA